MIVQNPELPTPGRVALVNAGTRDNVEDVRYPVLYAGHAEAAGATG